DGLAALPQASPTLRAALHARAAEEGWPALHAELAAIDPEAAARIAANDSQRIQRALEVCLSSGKRLSVLQRSTSSALAGTPLRYWLLCPGDRGRLHERLAQRFEAMLAAGFLEEVRALRARGGLTIRHPAMRAVGYRQLWAHLDGHCSLEEATRRAVAATRQLAKRQLTWMRAEKRAERLDPDVAELSWNRDIFQELGVLGL
ncbi:MAG: tRNA (adenosine(37)-N6)-dimethylallyltransferase MiaA, partial [Gammaproteobacteria bacterium]|nr:tRNA (adenosine(37)-N6)-dimethylallyltransferase MiaA [Gammaproteobacteria bacterium]